MEPRRIIAIGCSAGGVQTLSRLVSDLPPDIPAAICVVVHFPPDSTSVLPRILERAGKLPASHAHDGDLLEAGRIYVAPPDWHLVVNGMDLALSHAPAENGHRPAIDVLLRSVARTWNGRGIGVILSGTGDDGTAGLGVLRARGGVAIVQDPVEAIFAAMPRSALENVDVTYCVPVADMGPLLAGLAAALVEPVAAPQVGAEGAEDPAEESAGPTPIGGASGLTCPDCGGALWEIEEGSVLRFRCRVGHTFSPESLFDQQWDELEHALWAAVRALDERAALSRRIAARFRARGHREMAERFEARAQSAVDRAAVIQRALVSGSEANPAPASGDFGDSE
ncbi:MAG TPA: chemotaxis protein CheB [Thermomicrobiaceae bacterium]|nr:chemotaxis protein CheB [Thermomicrobiaceae bacterium]